MAVYRCGSFQSQNGRNKFTPKCPVSIITLTVVFRQLFVGFEETRPKLYRVKQKVTYLCEEKGLHRRPYSLLLTEGKHNRNDATLLMASEIKIMTLKYILKHAENQWSVQSLGVICS